MRLDAGPDGEAKLIFDVIDTGIGMSVDQSQLLQPFAVALRRTRSVRTAAAVAEPPLQPPLEDRSLDPRAGHHPGPPAGLSGRSRRLGG